MPKRINDEIRDKCVDMIRQGKSRREIRKALDLHEYQIKYIRQRYAPDVERIGLGDETETETETPPTAEEQEVEFVTETPKQAPPQIQTPEYQCGACKILFYKKTKFCANCGVQFGEY